MHLLKSIPKSKSMPKSQKPIHLSKIRNMMEEASPETYGNYKKCVETNCEKQEKKFKKSLKTHGHKLVKCLSHKKSKDMRNCIKSVRKSNSDHKNYTKCVLKNCKTERNVMRDTFRSKKFMKKFHAVMKAHSKK